MKRRMYWAVVETVAMMQRLAELWHEQPDQGPEEGRERDTYKPL